MRVQPFLIFSTLGKAIAATVIGSIVFAPAFGSNLAEARHVAMAPPNSETHEPAAASSETTADPPELEDLQHLQDLLQSACVAAESMSVYTATFELQEEVNQKLRPVERITMKVRREPFSVFMRWTDSGQEVLYVSGENNNRVIVKPVGGLAALRRVWRLKPESRMAMRTCRHPITNAGLEMLAQRTRNFYVEQDNRSSVAACESMDATMLGQLVTIVTVQFRDQEQVPEYHSSRLVFDRNTQLLIAVDNFGWPEGDEPRLIEHYHFHQISGVQTLTDQDFAEANPEYNFVDQKDVIAESVPSVKIEP